MAFVVGFHYDGKRINIPQEAVVGLSAFAAGVLLHRTFLKDKAENVSAVMTTAGGVLASFIFGATVAAHVGSIVDDFRRPQTAGQPAQSSPVTTE